MKNIINAALVVVSVLAVSAWTWDEYKSKDRGVVLMPNFYEQHVPAFTIFGKPNGTNHMEYFTGAKFVNRETGQGVTVGLVEQTRVYNKYGSLLSTPNPPPFYGYKVMDPGHYELVMWWLGGGMHSYDGDKCGHIRFDLTKNDVLLIKGIVPVKPITIEAHGILQMGHMSNYMEFKKLMPGYEGLMSNKMLVRDKKLKILDLKSDNPKAFQACVREDAAAATPSAVKARHQNRQKYSE